MPFAEQQRDAVLDDDARQRVAHVRAAVAQRDVFAAGGALVVELEGQHVIERAVEHAPQDVERARARRIVRIARDQGADGVEHAGSCAEARMSGLRSAATRRLPTRSVCA